MSHRRSNQYASSHVSSFDDQFQTLLDVAEALRLSVSREKESLIASRRDSQQRLSELEHKQRLSIADAEHKGRQAVLDENMARTHAIVSFEWLADARARTISREHDIKYLKDIDRADAAKEAINIFTKLHTDDVFHLTLNVTFKNETGRGEGVLKELLTLAWRDILADKIGPYFWGETWKLPSNNPLLLLPQAQVNTTYASRCCLLTPAVSIIHALGRLWVFSMAHGVFPAIHPVILKGLCDPASVKVSHQFALDLSKFSTRISRLIGALEKGGDVTAFQELCQQFPGLAVLDPENASKDHFPILSAYISDHVMYSHNKYIIQQFLQPFVINAQWASRSISSETDVLAMRATYISKITIDAHMVAKAFVLDQENSTSDEKDFVLDLLRKTVLCHYKSHSELARLLTFVTACATIQPIAVMVYTKNTDDINRRLPIVRTCIPRIELSDAYNTTDEVFHDLEFAMSCENATFSFI